MDVVSHTLVGAASAISFAKPNEMRAAAIAGGITANLPDLDALIRSSDDALLYLEYHRHFSHSLLFIPIGALFVSAALWRWYRSRVAFPRLYLFCLLGIALAGVLDACTSYGTHLLWPFSDARSAWNWISIVDPIFTVLLGIPVVFALWRSSVVETALRDAAWTRGRRLGALALLLGTSYVALGAWQHHRALQLLTAHGDANGWQAERVLVKPTFANVVLWRGIAESGDRVRVAGIRPRLFQSDRVYPGDDSKRVSTTDFKALPAESRTRSDIARFEFFSDGLLSLAEVSSARTVLGDARYAMRPDSLRPMWSIGFDPTHPERPVELIVDRTMSAADRGRFMEMLRGEP